MSVSSEPSSVELPLALRDALVRVLLAELASADAAGAVASALSLLCADLVTEHDPPDQGPIAARVPLIALRQALAGTDRAAVRTDGSPVSPAGPRAATLERARRYRDVLEASPRGSDLGTRLAQARVLLARHLFFEVHEILEPPWRDASGTDRLVLQGIIQAAVAWYHGAAGRRAAALRVASAAAGKLAGAPDAWHGFPIVTLREQLDRYRTELAGGDGPAFSRLTL